MSLVARYLRKQLVERTWRGVREMEALGLDQRFEELLRCVPPADVLLTSNDESHRLGIVFEVNRAAPVANQGMFVTSIRFRDTDRGAIYVHRIIAGRAMVPMATVMMGISLPSLFPAGTGPNASGRCG